MPQHSGIDQTSLVVYFYAFYIHFFIIIMKNFVSFVSFGPMCIYETNVCTVRSQTYEWKLQTNAHTHTHIVLLWEPYRRAIQTHTHRHSCKRGKGARNISLSIESPAQYTVAVYTVTSLRHKNQYGGLNRTERADFYSVLFSISFGLDVIFYLLYAFTGWNFRLLIRQKQETSKRIKKIFIK